MKDGNPVGEVLVLRVAEEGRSPMEDLEEAAAEVVVPTPEGEEEVERKTCSAQNL